MGYAAFRAVWHVLPATIPLSSGNRSGDESLELPACIT